MSAASADSPLHHLTGLDLEIMSRGSAYVNAMKTAGLPREHPDWSSSSCLKVDPVNFMVQLILDESAERSIPCSRQRSC